MAADEAKEIWRCLKAKTTCEKLYNQQYHRINLNNIHHNHDCGNDNIYIWNGTDIHMSTYNYYTLLQALTPV